ncbi:hypothetical protein F8S13_23965 [Chloroflexia bacterium SDU3-3]|nr:hypothetical protein F8S13_23965 [Chloroflexia bacterium SDU3-3]
MGIRAHFSDQEWRQIYEAPVFAGLVMITAKRSAPVQAVQEMFAVSHAIIKTDQRVHSSELIGEIVEAIKQRERYEKIAPSTSLGDAHAKALEHIRAAASLVDSRLPSESASFKRWLISIGQLVADTAQQGSTRERGGATALAEPSALRDLRRALGLA